MIRAVSPHHTLLYPVPVAQFCLQNTFMMSVSSDKTKIDNDTKATETLLETLRTYHSKIDDEETRHAVIGALSKVIEDLEEPFDLLMRLANSVCHMTDPSQVKANNHHSGRHDAIDQSWLPAWRV